MSVTRTVECPACNQESTVTYRCEHCGRDLAGEGITKESEQL